MRKSTAPAGGVGIRGGSWQPLEGHPRAGISGLLQPACALCGPLPAEARPQKRPVAPLLAGRWRPHTPACRQQRWLRGPVHRGEAIRLW